MPVIPARGSVRQLLATVMGDPLAPFLGIGLIPLLHGFVPVHLVETYEPSGAKRDARPQGPHIATSVPPSDRPPFPPDIDTARNPFGCDAFWRRFDSSGLPGVPGESSETVIKDTGVPSRHPWHAL